MTRWAHAAAVALVVAALGAPLGWLWAALAPDVPVQAVEGGVAPTEAQPEEFFAADGWFVLLGVGFGLLVALAMWFLVRRYRGPVGLVAMTLGAVGAGVFAWWLGHRIGLSTYHRQVREAAVGTTFDRPPDLRAKDLGLWLGFIPRVRGDLLVPAVTAAIVYTLLAGWSRYPSLRREEEAVSQDQFELGGTASSDSGTGTART